MLCIVGMLVGCRTQQLVHQPTVIASPDTTLLPTFPAEALYVLGAQWEADSLLQQEWTIADYIEQELIRLYPEKAYQGYLQRVCAMADRLLVSSQYTPTLFMPKRQEIHFASGYSLNSATPYAMLDSLTMEEEMMALEFTPQELADWNALQSLIESDQPLTREAFDTLDIAFFDEENMLLTLLLWRGPRLFYRVLQSKARAEKLAQYYYGDEILIDGKGGSYEDARHCFPGGWAHHEVNAFDPKQRTKEQKEVYNYLRSLLQFRKTSEALCYGNMTHFLPHDGIYCFFRHTENQTVMVVVNSNEKAKDLNLVRFDEMNIVGRQARNIATNRVVNLKESHKFAGKTVTILEIL